MFSPVSQAYRDHLIFSAALAVYLVAAGIAIIASNTPTELVALPILGALPFFWLRPLRRFASVFSTLVLGALLIVAGGEVLFRLRYFSSDAIVHFTAYAPVPPTMTPGFVSRSKEPVLRYVFTPGAKAYFNDRLWEINEDGFRDRSFSARKQPGVYRILLFGDSFALGVGVTREERFSSRVEAILNARGAQVEIYNLALAGLSFAEFAGAIETFGPRYGADMVMVGVRASQLHEGRFDVDEAHADPDEDPRQAGRHLSFVHRYSFVLNVQRNPVLAGLARIAAYLPRWGPRHANAASAPGDEPPFVELVERCAAYMHARGTPVVIVALRKMEFRSDQGLRASLANRALGGDASRRQDHEDIARITARLGVPFIDTYDAFDPDSRRSDFIIFPGDGHPNAAGHRRYAEAIAEGLMRQFPLRPVQRSSDLGS